MRLALIWVPSLSWNEESLILMNKIGCLVLYFLLVRTTSKLYFHGTKVKTALVFIFSMIQFLNLSNFAYTVFFRRVEFWDIFGLKYQKMAVASSMMTSAACLYWIYIQIIWKEPHGSHKLKTTYAFPLTGGKNLHMKKIND